MPEFFFTFGQKYLNELHPAGGHPDGWFVIEAENETVARAKMDEICGTKWAASYTKDRFDKDRELYGLGELKRFKA